MKVGEKYDYPDWRLHPALVETIKKIWGKFGVNKIDDKGMLAVFLGHTGTTGGFNSKMAALRAYGLIMGHGYVQVSDLGVRIANPEQVGDPFNAVKEAINIIPLWKILYEKYTSKNVDVSDKDFWVDLGKIAVLVPDEAKKAAKNVQKEYLDDIQYLNSLKGTQNGVKQMKDSSQINTSDANLSSGFTINKEPAVATTLSSGELLKGLFEKGAYDLAKQFIDFASKKDKPEKDKEQNKEEQPKT